MGVLFPFGVCGSFLGFFLKEVTVSFLHLIIKILIIAHVRQSVSNKKRHYEEQLNDSSNTNLKESHRDRVSIYNDNSRCPCRRLQFMAIKCLEGAINRALDA